MGAFRKFGHDGGLTRTQEYVGAPTGPWQPSAGVPLDVSSDSPEDDGKKVMILGLDDAFREIDEIVTLPATTTQSFRRCYRAYIVDTLTNVGRISLSEGGNVRLAIEADFGQTQVSGYTVPRRKKLEITGIHLVANSTNPVDLIFWQSSGAKRVVQQYTGIEGPAPFPYYPPIPFEEKTDLWFTARIKSGAGAVSVEYTGFLKRK